MKKQGFTLIELLAVIVILAIIALIAVPIIMNVIKESQKGAVRNSAYGLEKAAQYAQLHELDSSSIKDIVFTYVDGVETSEPSGYFLNYKGQKPQSGNVFIRKDGKVALALFSGKYCALKGIDAEEVVIDESKTEETCVLEELPVIPNEEGNGDTSGASKPEVSAGMIPVLFEAGNPEGQKWVKADITQEWYDYENKHWANVVLVTENTRSIYQSNSAIGQPILDTDILAHLVWIPRYRYQLFNSEAVSIPVQTIQIQFEHKDIGSYQKAEGDSTDAWLTHPAFTFGIGEGSELNGFWVGKFETTGNAITPTIKPNIASLRNQNVSTQFATSQKFSNTSTYGLAPINDAHMMKNTQWGAVTYLTHSVYGKNAEVWMNPAYNYTTGCAGTGPSVSETVNCDYPYYTINGIEASTTGNIYGIYDMSGGAWEYVMGVMTNPSDVPYSGYNLNNNSGFTGPYLLGGNHNGTAFPDSKYYDKYEYGTSLVDQYAYDRRILGDATGEVRGWNTDYAQFVSSSNAWFHRGGYRSNVTNSGIFSFNNYSGHAVISVGFRVVILGEQ